MITVGSHCFRPRQDDPNQCAYEYAWPYGTTDGRFFRRLCDQPAHWHKPNPMIEAANYIDMWKVIADRIDARAKQDRYWASENT